MADRKQIMLKASTVASEVLAQFSVKERLVRRLGGIDVYQLAEDLDVPVMFLPLKSFLGAYMCESEPGIAVTTQRTSSIQRFTCAHEVGHHVLRHETTLDTEQDIAAAGAAKSSEVKELEANVFAAHLIMPRWLIRDRASELMKAGLRLPSPVAAYQLSLRLGCSYAATIFTLKARELITANHFASLSSYQPKDIKKAMLGEYQPTDWKRDVWMLTGTDDGEEVLAQKKDLIVLQVKERSTSGYVSEFMSNNQGAVSLVRETIQRPENINLIGNSATYEATVELTEEARSKVKVVQRRPWEDRDAASLALRLDVDSAVTDHNGLTKNKRNHQVDSTKGAQ